MAFEIEFSLKGVNLGSVKSSEPLEEVIKIARAGYAKNDADVARIFDLENDDEEVWSRERKRAVESR